MSDAATLGSSRSFYSAPVFEFLRSTKTDVLGSLLEHSTTVEGDQGSAWSRQIDILQDQFQPFPDGHIFFEFRIPRVGRRADIVLVEQGVVFVVEFKVNEREFRRADLDQAEGYAVDLKNFHEGSHSLPIVPILVATDSPSVRNQLSRREDDVYAPLRANSSSLGVVIAGVLEQLESDFVIADLWANSPYKPTPTIIEAAAHLYSNHDVTEIAQSGAGAQNLALTSRTIEQIVQESRTRGRKSVCFVTGVPGAGKTLVGLTVASASDKTTTQGDLAVYLSGNGPLVTVLREALARDDVTRQNVRKKDALRKVERFIQNIHHFRDEALLSTAPPAEHVAIFDEAQRAWDKPATSKFMQQKKNQPNFDQSEPEFLIGYMDRHDDWCVIVALIGGGQEINVGEAGLPGWFDALEASYREWDIYYSPELNQAEYDGGKVDFAELSSSRREVAQVHGLHLSTSMRSFRAEHLSHVVHHVISNAPTEARREYDEFRSRFPLKITRSLDDAKTWVRDRARGFESYGLVASSGGMRLRPEGIHVKNSFDAANWFLNDRNDIRSSYFLETVATEFDIQGLELDWTIVAWDADLR
jgi:hypothetical protein